VVNFHGGNKTQNSAGCIVGTKVAGTPLGNLFAELNSLTLGMPETSANGEAFYRLPIPIEVDVMGAVTQPTLHLGASGVTVGGNVQLTLTVDNFPRPARPTGAPFFIPNGIGLLAVLGRLPFTETVHRHGVPALAVSFAENRLGAHSFGRGINWLRPILGILA
jgi:hypothetical protein